MPARSGTASTLTGQKRARLGRGRRKAGRYGGGAMADAHVRAAAYDRVMAWAEAHGVGERRRRLLSGARGRVLDVGAGTGANLAHLPGGRVTSVVALEPDRGMRRRLEERARGAPVPVEVLPRGIEDAGFDDASFDTVVAVLVLCTVPDLDATAGALIRWLRPGGELLFLEHMVAPGVRGSLQRAATPLWARVTAGCHLDRDPIAALRRAGFVVADLDHFTLPGGGALIGNGVFGRATARRAGREEVA
jgi:SAM-dependent methyltransferase